MNVFFFSYAQIRKDEEKKKSKGSNALCVGPYLFASAAILLSLSTVCCVFSGVRLNVTGFSSLPVSPPLDSSSKIS